MHIPFLFEALILSVALSVDALLASFAYGSQKMKISIGATLIIGLLCGGLLGLTLHLGTQMSNLVHDGLARWLGFAILFILGILRVFDSWLKNWIRRRGERGQINFSVFRLRFILQVYADPRTADTDGSRTLSPTEAFSLALALSLDGIAAGLGAGLTDISPLFGAGLTMILTMTAIVIGGKLGCRISGLCTRDISWGSGGLLILLAVLQL